MAQNTEIPYSEAIAERVRDGIRHGVTIRVIFDSICGMRNSPGSMQTFYKLYKKDIEEARFEYQNWLGEKATDRIKEGSDKILELALRSKAGWNPQETIVVASPDDEREETSALDDLMAALGKVRGKEEDES